MPTALPDVPIAVASLATPWGPAVVAASVDGIHAIALLADESNLSASVVRRTRRPIVAPTRAPGPIARAIRDTIDDLDRYVADGARFGGWRRPVALLGVSDWDVRVLSAVAAIPVGTTASYGMVAQAAGSPGAARAAGGAVGRNPAGLVVPCHRVIAGDGTIGGYGGSWSDDREALVELKRSLLAHEGVEL
ncbi:MAG TPA: methylated-DNA--[protein]-cysteine S-methyltransferase [Candidatus Limnocylindrales bacterium]